MATIYIRTIVVIVILTAAKNIVDTEHVEDNNPSPSVVATEVLDAKKNVKNDVDEQLKKGKCECGVFNTPKPTQNDEAIFIQSPIDVSCDESGDENCLKLCSALAQAAKEKGPEVLCSALGHVKNLKASIHSRICGAKEWTYTNLTAPHDVCCHDHQVTTC